MSAPDEEYVEGDVNTVDVVEDVDDSDDYVEGDINTVGAGGSSFDDEAEDGPDGGGTSTSVLNYIAQSLANEPDAVVVQTDERRGSVRLRLHVAPEDMGRVIGRRGRTAQAIRTLVAAAGARDGVQTSVDIVDD